MFLEFVQKLKEPQGRTIMNLETTKNILDAMIAERSQKRKEFFRTYEPPKACRDPEGETFTPLPSDLIQDAKHWPEWTLTENFKVIKK